MLKHTLRLPIDDTSIEVDIYGIDRVTYNFAASRKIVIFVPGLTCKNWSNYLGVYADLAGILNEHGFLCLILASRGQQPSGGAWLHENAVEDLETVSNFLYSQGAAANSVGLFARSIGTSIALTFIQRKPHKVSSVALWGTSFKRIYDSFFGNLEVARRLMESRLTTIDESFVFTDQMLAEHLLPNIQHPLWMGYGTEDIYSTFEEQIEAFKLSPSNISSFVAIRNATHEMDASNPAFPLYSQILANWFAVTLST